MASLEAVSLKVMLNLTEMRQESEASINAISTDVIAAGETSARRLAVSERKDRNGEYLRP